MAIPNINTVSERLFWCYANLAMAEAAVHKGCAKYGRAHFMIRTRLYNGLTSGDMSPASLMRDQIIRLKLPQECVYCGATEHLSIDHIIPSNRGGNDSGDNAIWACRRCNSSKSDRDLFEWWAATQSGFPPLFVVRIYLKQAMQYYETQGMMQTAWRTMPASPYDLNHLPETFPAPNELLFTPHHHRERSVQTIQSEKRAQQGVAGYPPQGVGSPER